MKYIHKITALATTTCLLLFTSCDSDLEAINQNPNDPEIVPTTTIFNSATKELTDISRGAFSSGRIALPWVQYWTQNNYANEDAYLYRESSATDFWEDHYKLATDFKKILDLNTDEETKATMSKYGSNNNQIAAARIMLSYIFHQLTDTFGDIPYYSYGNDNPDFQALQVNEFLTPKFVSQEVIYTDLLSELKAASDMIETSEKVFTSGDAIYNGDAVKWKKFANSLILRVANRLRGVDPTTANTAINTAIGAGVFESNDDNAAQIYEAADATGSPMYRAFFVNNRTDFGVAAPFINVLRGESGSFGQDPRLFKYAAPNSATAEQIKDNSYTVSTNIDDYDGFPYAFPNAAEIQFTTYTLPSHNVLRQDYSEVLMEYAEVAFILSEHNGWDQTEYENGVQASMEKWGVDSGDITDFIANLPAAAQESVLTQKYVALYMQPYEAWAEYRRTGFPKTLLLPGEEATITPEQFANLSGDNPSDKYIFTPGVADMNDLPTRLRYPVVLQTLNGANRKDAVSKLSNGDDLTSKLYWDNN
ncbi:SusD/RagB family nutrient-binding outer membrane lipoprotein [Aquimarina sp. TRL1]|uniref:SusD/RagB family nutrient-binding outer membrane lipoprotein n=1 Tax=Aquimarina sp. (strain TRL1) TaxID=2736252 RepID=UPI00158F24C4|nr:SusD/RagB family nutrient-binding outer membrane lipoprotein [Aquimarina sp. TRL1]QKX03760.1 SusD/RagB family nutrient-binding outer membrane lipoprotein [Aquimarina sp. TRL1]